MITTYYWLIGENPPCSCDVHVMWHQHLLCHACLRFSWRASALAPQGQRRFACNCPWFAYSVAVKLIDWLWPSGVSVRRRRGVMGHALTVLCSFIFKKYHMKNWKTKSKKLLSLCRTIFLVLLFSQYARNVHFPLPVYKAKKGWTSYRLQVFKMFPVSMLL